MASAMAGTDMEQQLRYEVGNIRRAFASEDGQEARRAVREGPAPVVQGREVRPARD
jgi:2-(1,2-epoxy-1,2-dihydrophenyl)acetyl-CoA isomerase